MTRFLTYIWREHRTASVLFGVAALSFVYFLADFGMKASHFSHPENRERQLELWMPPRYVAQSWQIPRPIMFDIFELEHNAPHEEIPRTVGAFLDDTGMTLEELQARVEAAKAELRAGQDN